MFRISSLRGRLETTAYCRTLPNYQPGINRYWMLPDRFRTGRWAMETIAHIRLVQLGELCEIMFPTGDVLYTEDAVPCWNVVHMYLTVTYMGQYFQRHAPQLGDVVLDVGANVGAFALAAARRVGPAGHIYCIEPVPSNQAALARTIEMNGLTNVTIIPQSVGETCGTLLLHRAPQGGRHSGLFEFDNGLDDLTAPMTTLDALTEEIGISRLDFLKIDVEGMERSVLGGATATLRRHKPYIVAASYHLPTDSTVLPQIITEAEPSYTVECGGQPSWCEPNICASCTPITEP